MASDHETIFTMEATPVKFGAGASEEAGWELKRLGVKRAMLVTDPGVAALGHPERIAKLIEDEGIEVVVYDRARVEPTIDSFQDAADFALEHEVDGFVSVGGGSPIDATQGLQLWLRPQCSRPRQLISCPTMKRPICRLHLTCKIFWMSSRKRILHQRK